jgi:predicted phage terminase large subunit-like protein
MAVLPETDTHIAVPPAPATHPSAPAAMALTPAEARYLMANLHLLTEAEQVELLSVLEELERREHASACATDLLTFTCAMDPQYKVGTHHRQLAELLTQVAHGERDRIGVSIPPRHGKSTLTSVMFVAWYLGNNPTKQVMLVSHTADLAVNFGRKVRNLIASDAYQAVFPHVHLAIDSKSAGRWNTNQGGGFYATGVGSALAGRGADLLLIDDPHNEQELLAGDFSSFQKTYEWFTIGARTRLMKGGAVAVIHTRWHPADLIGQLTRDMASNPLTDQYEFFEFPAIFYEGTDHEKALWPEFFDLDTLHRTKASMPLYQWNAQYQQNPTGKEGAIVPREKWRKWTDAEPPQCEYVIMTVDAAAEEKTRSDFSAIGVWGVFRSETLTAGEAHVILLNVVKDRVAFPVLKSLALREYQSFQPDAFIVEKKSNGTALYQEFRRMGIPVQGFDPSRKTGDKVVRLNAVADLFECGMVWYPAGKRWAEELIEQVAAFPVVDHDDLVDITSMALARFRQGGFLVLPTDAVDEPAPPRRPGAKRFYDM